MYWFGVLGPPLVFTVSPKPSALCSILCSIGGSTSQILLYKVAALREERSIPEEIWAVPEIRSDKPGYILSV